MGLGGKGRNAGWRGRCTDILEGVNVESKDSIYEKSEDDVACPDTANG